MNGQTMVKATNVYKYFGDFCALRDVSLEVARGEVLSIIGPSGSGKSTILRCINQLEKADKGAIWIDGELAGYRRVNDALYELSDKEIARQRVSIGMVFQRFNLFGHMTALENIIEGPVTVLRRPRSEAVEEAMALLDRVGLSAKHGSYPAQLSGGQQAESGHRPVPGHAPEADALRRTDLGPRSRTRGRCSGGHEGPGHDRG